jgi:1-acyl-sn-glycerol-3-phosphate acyltransferase
MKPVAKRSPQCGFRHRLAHEVLIVLLRVAIRFIANVDLRSLDVPTGLDSGCIIVANHRSLLDLPLSLLVFDNWRISPSILIREELFQRPLLGRVLRTVGGLPAGAINGTSAMRASLQTLHDGGIVAIMPEGRIRAAVGDSTPVGRLMPGAARLASASGRPILVAGIINTDVAWPPESPTPKFRLRRSRRPHVRIATEWLLVEQRTSNSQILVAVDNSMRSLLRRLHALDQQM